MEKQKKIFIHDIYGALFASFASFQVWKYGTEKKFLYIYVYIYINLPKLGFYGLDTVPFRPCIFTNFSLLYIFCTKMGVLGVLGYVYTYGRKIKKI